MANKTDPLADNNFGPLNVKISIQHMPIKPKTGYGRVGDGRQYLLNNDSIRNDLVARHTQREQESRREVLVL